jgi:hypothetical protein
MTSKRFAPKAVFKIDAVNVVKRGILYIQSVVSIESVCFVWNVDSVRKELLYFFDLKILKNSVNRANSCFMVFVEGNGNVIIESDQYVPIYPGNIFQIYSRRLSGTLTIGDPRKKND